MPSLLVGLLFDSKGRRLTPSHANKSGKRYRYYISETIRLPASEVETVVALEIACFLENSGRLIEALAAPDDDVAFRRRLRNLGGTAALRLKDGDPLFSRTAIQAFVTRVEVGTKTLTVTCPRLALRQWLIDPKVTTAKLSNQNPSDVVELAVPFTLKRRGVEAKLILDGDANAQRLKPDPALIKAVARAYVWNQKLMTGEIKSIRALAQTTGLTRPYVKRLLKLAFLSPDIVQAILAGRQPVDLTAQRLTRLSKLPCSWKEQRVVLDFVN